MNQTYLAFLRAVNVGGTSLLPMAELVRILTGLGLANVRTYIQSGNAVFTSRTSRAALPTRIASGIEESRGFAPDVIFFSLSEFEAAIAANPFSRENPKAVCLMLLASRPTSPDLEALRKACVAGEQFSLCDRVLYALVPEGVGNSKLFPRIEKSLGVRATGRNWRTASRMLEMSREVDGLNKASVRRGNAR